MLLDTDMMEDVLAANRSVNPAGSGAIYPREFLQRAVTKHERDGEDQEVDGNIRVRLVRRGGRGVYDY